ncbi:MAG: type II toxin-antitoxin system RelE/ParE family toxin [Fimbriiglobus sp.]
MSLPFHPEARREAERAVAWTADNRSARDALRLVDALERAADEIAAQPRRYPAADDGPDGAEVRNLVLLRLPYRVVFLVRPEGVIVLAVAHTSREPGYWTERLC